MKNTVKNTNNTNTKNTKNNSNSNTVKAVKTLNKKFAAAEVSVAETVAETAAEVSVAETVAETVAEKPVYVATCVAFDDGTVIQKQFRSNALPAYAVLVLYCDHVAIGAPSPHHVLCYTSSIKIAESHVRRIKKQYIGNDASIRPNYYSAHVQIVPVMTLSDYNANQIENKSWARARNAANKLAQLVALSQQSENITA